MSRKTIFEILDLKWDLKTEVSRIYDLFQVKGIIFDNQTNSYVLRDFVDRYLFQDWKYRGRCIDLADYLNCLEYDALIQIAADDIDLYFILCELVYNIYYLAENKIEHDSRYSRYRISKHLKTILDSTIEHYNYQAFFEDDRVLIIEKDPAVTATVEIESDRDIAYEVIRYNHYTLRSDLASKRSILLRLGVQLESQRRDLAQINKGLETNIFLLLNNLNIRHNNVTQGNCNFQKAVTDMAPDELENWYDELYQMVLLAKLELDNVERTKKVSALKATLTKE